MSQAIIMIFINITSFVLISLFEEDHSLIETCCLKNVVIFSKQFQVLCCQKSYQILIHHKRCITSGARLIVAALIFSLGKPVDILAITWLGCYSFKDLSSNWEMK